MKRFVMLTAIIMALAVLSVSPGFAQNAGGGTGVTGTIEVYVAEDTGDLTVWEPISGADVTCRMRGGKTVTQQTDEEGFIAFKDVPMGWSVVKVAKEGFEPQNEKVLAKKNETKEVKVYLKPAVEEEFGALEGIVSSTDGVTEDKTPVSEARVMLIFIPKGFFSEGVLTGEKILLPKEDRLSVRNAVTDADGNFKFENLPVGDYLVKVSKKGYKQTLDTVSVNSGETAELNPVLVSKAKPLAPITGAVSGYVYCIKNDIKEPISGVAVAVSLYFPYPTFAPLPVFKATSDENGYYTVSDLTPGEYNIFVEVEGYKNWEARVKVAAGKNVSKDAVLVPAGAEDGDDKTTASLKGHVYDGAANCADDANCVGVPVAEANVTLFLNSEERHAVTDKDGYYEFPELSGGIEYTMTVKAEKYQYWKGLVKIEEGENVKDVTLNPAAAECSGNGECGSNQYCSKDMGNCESKGICKPKPDVCTEEYLPVCGCDGKTYGNLCAAQAAGVNAAYKGECVSPDKMGTLTGQVSDSSEEGKAVANARVVIFEATPISSVQPKEFFANTDEKGYYKIADIPAGKYYMAVKAEGYQKCEGDVEIAAGSEVVKDVKLSLMEQNARILKGNVYDGSVRCGEGERCIVPIAKADVTIVLMIPDAAGNMPEQHAVTNEEGYYEFLKLPGGEYQCRMVVKAEKYLAWEGVVKIALSENIWNVNLMPALECSENAECGEKNFCAKVMGNCEGSGVCRPMPEACPTVYIPVCGCDGKTYGNDCEAASAGVNPAYKGECYSSDKIGSLSGKVSAEDGHPVGGAAVFVFEVLSPEVSFLPKEFQTKTGDDGNYKFSAIPAGDYKIAVKAETYLKWEGEAKIVAAEESVVNLTLAPGPTTSVLKGHVYDGSVKCDAGEKCIAPISGANVRLYIWNAEGDKELSTVTDEEGYYEFTDLPVGNYQCTLVVEAEKYQPFKDMAMIEPGENVKDVNLMPPPQVCKDSSECSSDQFCAKPFGACEGAEGMCRPKPEVCPDIYLPVCGCDGKTYSTECDASVAGVTVAYKGECFSPDKVGTLSGHVYDAEKEGIFLTGAEILVFANTFVPNDYPKEYNAKTDAEGFYKLENLPAGDYTMVVKAVGYQAWKDVVNVVAGGNAVKDVKLFPAVFQPLSE